MFGEGSQAAAMVLVGEQPGDQDDKHGRAFVGPAGRVLDRALGEAGGTVMHTLGQPAVVTGVDGAAGSRGAIRLAARDRALLMIRAGYGTALLLVPGPAIRLATGRVPSQRARRVAQLLGARHLVQAALTCVAPRPGVFAAGAQVDTVHAASMLLLAAADEAGRRAALTDAVAEAAFAAAGFRTGA